MTLLLGRAVWQDFVTEETIKGMRKINDCLHCGQCAARCPYELDTPNLLKQNLADYEAFLKEKGLTKA
jgi:predicted aldo/keto reductase-like oxidoreductase